MALEFKSGGRSISLDQFMENIKKQAIQKAMDHIAEKFHGKAASLVDPETGKQPVIFIRPVGDKKLLLKTNGSTAYAVELERRMGLNRGSVTPMNSAPPKKRLVYLAHASEDKEIAKPIAEGLLANGIDVWFDQWEIRTGDSLRRKMEQGLADCTHFVVLLSPRSIQKAWVQEEIDAGLTAQVDGSAKFLGLRIDLPVSGLTPFLRTRLCPEIVPSEQAIANLAADILDVSLKPQLGNLPRYVKPVPYGLAGWSSGAIAVAEFFCRNSRNGTKFDPQSGYDEIISQTSLPLPDIRLGVLDLCDAGLVERVGAFGGDSLYPLPSLFTEFDSTFMKWNPQDDAKKLAIFLYNLGAAQVESGEVGRQLQWEPRRFNPAMNYLIEARIVEGVDSIGGGDYRPTLIGLGDNLLRYVRNSI